MKHRSRAHRRSASGGPLALLLTAGAGLAAPAVPLDPVTAIVAAFEDHDMVALGEGNHGNLPAHALRLALIRDPGFRAAARDIVVEFGNSRHQDTIDRFVSGEDVPDAELRRVWQDTAQANPVWDVPIYEEFFRAVRDVNAELPPSERLRIVLGDAPIDWSAVRTLEDYNSQPQRSDASVVEIVRDEILSRERNALVIYGDLHFLRLPLAFAGDAAGADAAQAEATIVTGLEAAGVDVFSIFASTAANLAALQPDVTHWTAPSLALLADTPLGEAKFTEYYNTTLVRDGETVNLDPARAPAMQDQFDAVLYLGPPASIGYSLPSPSMCANADYLEMRFFRMELVGWSDQVEQARQYCAMVASAAGGE